MHRKEGVYSVETTHTSIWHFKLIKHFTIPILPINWFEDKEELHSWIWKSCRIQDVLHQMQLVNFQLFDINKMHPTQKMGTSIVEISLIMQQQQITLYHWEAVSHPHLPRFVSYWYGTDNDKVTLPPPSHYSAEFAIHYIYPLSYNMHTTNSSRILSFPLPQFPSISTYAHTSREYPMESSLSFFLTPQSKTTTHHQSDTSLFYAIVLFIQKSCLIIHTHPILII